MDKLNLRTADWALDNYRKLAELFPNAVTEIITGYTVDGRTGREKPILERAIDADVLRQEIAAHVVEGRTERYQFTWPDKRKAVLSANAPIDKTLRPCREESVEFDTTENLYIEGDNLEVLKLLQETYLGRIKVIYIDPPYNTGTDKVYKDDFAQDIDDYLANSGQRDAAGNRLVQNAESSGRLHTDWLNMIYPRLRLARELLAEDGVIFISIDDNEQENLKRCCDELLGPGNFVTQFVVASNSAKNNSRFVSVSHEYILCYAKSKERLPQDWAVSRSNTGEFTKRAKALLQSGLSEEEVHEELLALVKFPRFFEFDHYTYADKRGPFRASDLTAPGSKAFYDVIHPKTGKACKTGTRGWAYSQAAMEELIAEERVYFGEDETAIPQLKNYLFENERTLPKSVLFFDSQSSTKWMKANKFGFDFPKSVDLMQFVLSMYPERDVTVLDFFSGSATTAHAVMQLNAEDGGRRRFIMVQWPEETGEKSEAYQSGFRNICEIGKERIRRAGAGIRADYPSAAQDLDVGFRVLKCDASNMKEVCRTPEETRQEQMNFLADNIKPDRSPEDLLFQVMLELGVSLSSAIEVTEIAGKRLFDVGHNFLLACFDAKVTGEVVTEAAKRKPKYFVMRDSSMIDDAVAANFEQIFQSYSPDTVRKVL